MTASTLKVTCSKCHKRAEIMEPDKDHPDEVIWKCPQLLENGIDMCGQTNSTTVSG